MEIARGRFKYLKEPAVNGHVAQAVRRLKDKTAGARKSKSEREGREFLVLGAETFMPKTQWPTSLLASTGKVEISRGLIGKDVITRNHMHLCRGKGNLGETGTPDPAPIPQLQ